MDIIDYTQGGQCSRCGACCTNYLPLTKTEFKRLRRWVRKHKFKPEPVVDALDFTCPFLDKESLKCVCYEIRPAVCQKFSCHAAQSGLQQLGSATREVYNLREMLFSEDSVSVQEYFLIMNYLRSLNNEQT